MSATDALPVLWHLKVSNYNEKARFALDYKGVPHVRRAVQAGRHPEVARRLTGGETFPVLVADGEAIGDSTRIIAWLEEHRPEPPLYPADADERARALELEDFFDEQLGPYVRRLVIHHMLPDAALFLGAFVPDMSRARRRLLTPAFPLLRRRLIRDFELDDRGLTESWERIATAGERVRAELGDGGYLVGDRFTVADLTLAALVAPAIAPEQFPYPQPQRDHPRLAPLRAALDEAGIGDFCRKMYARHRGTSAEVRDGR
jgi:glutathione S-transferase